MKNEKVSGRNLTVLQTLRAARLRAAPVVSVEVEGERGAPGRRAAALTGAPGVLLQEEVHTHTHTQLSCATLLHQQQLRVSKHRDGSAVGVQQGRRLLHLRRGGIQRAKLRPLEARGGGGGVVLLPQCIVSSSSRSHGDAADTQQVRSKGGGGGGGTTR